MIKDILKRVIPQEERTKLVRVVKKSHLARNLKIIGCHILIFV